MKIYTVTNSATELNVPVYANSLDEANYKALTTYGLDAVGCNIVNNEDGSFRCNVVAKAWADVLERYFKGFTMDDVLNHLIVTSYAWLNFEHEKRTHWDYDGEYTTETLCDEGFTYIHEHDPLAVKMDEIGFEW